MSSANSGVDFIQKQCIARGVFSGALRSSPGPSHGEGRVGHMPGSGTFV